MEPFLVGSMLLSPVAPLARLHRAMAGPGCGEPPARLQIRIRIWTLERLVWRVSHAQSTAMNRET